MALCIVATSHGRTAGNGAVGPTKSSLQQLYGVQIISLHQDKVFPFGAESCVLAAPRSHF